jgi:hypothetical protein
VFYAQASWIRRQSKPNSNLSCRHIHRLPGTALNNRFTVATDKDFERNLQAVIGDYIALGSGMSLRLGTPGDPAVAATAAGKVPQADRSRWALQRTAWERATPPLEARKADLRTWKSSIAKDTIKVPCRSTLAEVIRVYLGVDMAYRNMTICNRNMTICGRA